MDVLRRFGRNVKRLREQNGWSQEELAERVGMHRTYISGMERGIRNPTLTIIDRLAKGLAVEVGTLTDHEEKSTS